MKKINGKNKIILLSSLSFSTLVSSVVVSSAASTSLEKKTNLLNKDSINETISSFTNQQRDISSNIEQTSNLQNPNELFYTSVKLTPEDAPVIGNESDVPPVPSTKDTTKNEENLKKWKDFKENLENLSKDSQPSTLLTELIEICKQVQNTYDLSKILKNFDEMAEDNPLIDEATLEQLKQTVINNSGSYQKMEEIPNIDSINEKLLQLSGIVEGTEIGLIKNPNSFTKKDLSQSTASSSKQDDNNLSISNVAGQNFKQLIKVAEIDPNQNGNYALMFSYKENSNAFEKEGVLYIKNDQGQLQQGNIKDLIKSLDVFGRFNVQNGSSIGKSNNSTNKLQNFIIQKKDNNVEILIRVNENEIIENLKFASNVDLPNASNLVSPIKFGILDVQASDNSTFRSLIENNGQTPQSVNKLVENIESSDIIKEVQFFSNTLSSSRPKQVTNDNDILQDRKLEFYQGPNVNLSLPLFFAFEKNYLGSNSSFSDNQTFSYKPLNIFVGGSDSNSQQIININSLSDKASTIEPSFFSMDETLKKTLEENNSSKISEDFKNASTISLKSSFDSSTRFTKQTLTFSDYFYAIGSREEGWFSINRANATSGITILDPTQKIFLERPESFKEESNSTIDSQTFAQETINERTKVIDILSSVYEQFSNSNSGDFQGQRFSLGVVNLWSFSKSGNSYSNIRLNQRNISGSGHDIFNTLNNNWTDLSRIMNNIFGASTSETRYRTKEAVGNFLANITEFTTNSVAVETILSDSIDIVKASLQDGNFSENTNYNSLTISGKNKLATKLVELISLQFSTISNEFSMRQYEPIYQELKKAIYDNQTKSQYQIIKSPSNIFELTSVSSLSNADLITYKENAWNELATNQETSLAHAVYNLLLLVYHSNAASGDLLSIKLGDSIFSSSELNRNFRSLSAYDLVNLNSDSINSKAIKVSIYNKILTFFGNSSFDMQNTINQMLKTGRKINEVWNINLDSAFRTIINNIVSKEPKRLVTTNNNTKVSSHYLDDIVSGTNAIITLVARLKQLGVSTINDQTNNNNNNQNVTNADLISKINSILNTNSQASSSELAIWSNIVNGTYDYAKYSEELSGRTGKENVEKVAKTIASNEAILNARSSLTSPAIVELQSVLKILWWVVVALIGVGILVSSSIGIGIKHKEEKLSTHPVLKWILISGIVLGTIVLVLAIVLGIFVI